MQQGNSQVPVPEEEFDAQGRLIQKRDRNKLVSCVYDAQGRLISKREQNVFNEEVKPSQSEVIMRYAVSGRLIESQTINATGNYSTRVYEYDMNGRRENKHQTPELKR